MVPLYTFEGFYFRWKNMVSGKTKYHGISESIVGGIR